MTAREKQFKLFALVLILTGHGQVKRLIWIQTDIIESETSRFPTTGKYWLLKIFKFLLHVTVALDQRKQKYTKFLKFRVQE